MTVTGNTTPLLPLIVEPAELETRLGAENLLLVDLRRPDAYARYHVPGAVHLDYAALVAQRGMARSLLPDDEHLEEVFSSLGLTPDTHVVAYDDEGGGMASRLLWTLDAVGHRHFSLLNGGIQAWHNEDHAGRSGIIRPQHSVYKVSGEKRSLADAEYVMARLGDPRTVVLDARSPNEYFGLTRTALRNGHMPGAVNLDWGFAMDPGRNLRIKPAEELRGTLHGLGITPDKEVIVHCHSHHRSAYTYVVLKALGYAKVKAYAGSWSEWGNRNDTPVEAGQAVLAA